MCVHCTVQCKPDLPWDVDVKLRKPSTLLWQHRYLFRIIHEIYVDRMEIRPTRAGTSSIHGVVVQAAICSFSSRVFLRALLSAFPDV